MGGVVWWQSFATAHGACDAASDSEVARALAAAVERAVSVSPRLPADVSAFAAFLGERLAGEPVTAARVEALHLEDLVLAWACAEGDDAACAEFTARYRARLQAVVSRVLRDDAARQDVVQRVLSELLASRGERAPKVAAYRGHAPLLSFVCVVAVNAARDAVRRRGAERIEGDDGELDLIADSVGDPELEYLRELYRREYRASFERALTGITREQRLLLKLDVIDRLTVRQAAVIYGRSPATTARHLIEARAAVASATVEDLRARLGLDEGEMASIARLVRSSLDLSVARLIGSDTAS